MPDNVVDLPAAEDLAIQAAWGAGAVVRRWFGARLAVETKSSDTDLVTQADRAAEREIFARIQERFPAHLLLGEESGWSGTDDGRPVWVVDPLDGTSNFVHGLPCFAVSIALVVAGEVQVGVVYDPMADELYSAVRGRGARLNGRPIRVDDQTSLATSLLATRTPRRSGGTVENLENYARVAARCRSLRSLGAAALETAYVAAGRLSGYWELRLSPWDFAAAALLVQEAGGRVTRADGSPLAVLAGGSLLATNGQIHAELLSQLGAAAGPGQRD